MFYLRNTNIDDLFREAAEGYPLDAEKASDWESVHAALANTKHTEIIGDKRRNRRLLFWLFFLLPLLVCMPVVFLFRKEPSVNHTVHAKNNLPVLSQDKLVNNEPDIPQTQKTMTKPDVLKKERLSSARIRSTSRLTVAPFLHDEVKKNDPETNQPVSNTSGNSSDRLTDMGKGEIINSEGISLHHNIKEQAKEPDASVRKEFTGSLIKIDHNNHLNSVSDEFYNDYLTKQLSKLSVNNLAGNLITPNIKLKNRSFFYLGLFSGADLSYIKSQRVSNAGYSFGVLIGYHINKKIGIETGAILEKKYYYSSGEYFDKKAVAYLNNINILSVNGNCNMINIPVNIKYNFLSHKKSTWFATTGLSSYIMTKEYYDYNYEYNSSYGHKGYTYLSSSKNWFSVINLSLGYQHDLGKNFMWRIEPYFKLPASGVGLGKLPLSSTGLYVGINKRIN